AGLKDPLGGRPQFGLFSGVQLGMRRDHLLSFLLPHHRQPGPKRAVLGDLPAKRQRFRRRRRRGEQECDRHHSANPPSLVLKIGLRQRCRSLSASRTAASSISTPSPGPSATGRNPPTGVSASLLMQKLSRSCPPVL